MTETIGEAERALMLRCVERDVDSEQIRELVVTRIDWNAFFVAALWHKVAFLVYCRLRMSGAIDLALTRGTLHLLLLNHWKQLTKVNEIRSRLYAEVAAEICGIAAEMDVDLAIAKGGPALFGWTYTYAERKCYDVDFLGRRHQLDDVQEVFRRAGFAFGEYSHARELIEPARPGDLRKHLLQGRGLPNFLRKPDSAVVDYLVAQLRFRIGAGAGTGNWATADALLDEAICRNRVRVVQWPDLALQLALHIHREANEIEYQSWNLDWNLIKLCDFDRIVHMTAPGGIVDGLVERAKTLGFAAEVAFAAEVTGSVFRSPVLDEIVSRLGGRTRSLDDSSEIQDKIWSVGDFSASQDGKWVDIVGAKST